MSPRASTLTAAGTVLLAVVCSAAVAKGIAPFLVLLLVVVLVGYTVALGTLGPHRLVRACVLAAVLFASMPALRVGIEPADVMMFTAIGTYVLTRGRGSVARVGLPHGPIRTLLAGLAIIAVAGLVGGLFEPSEPVYTVALSYTGSALGPVPAFIADTIRFTIGTVLAVIGFCLWRPGRDDLRKAARLYLYGATISVLWSFVAGAPAFGRPQGLSTHPVTFGLNCAMGCMFAFGLLAAGSRKERVVALACGAVCGVGALQSGTRASLVVIVVGLIFFQLTSRSARAWLIPVVGGFLLLAITVVAPSFLGSSPTLTRLSGGDTAEISNAARDQARQETIDLIKTHGLTGAGFGYLDPPHNLVLGVIATGGVVAFGGLVVVVGSIVVGLGVLGRRDLLWSAVGGGILACYAGFWVVNVAWDRWLWYPVAMALLAATMMARDERAGRRRQSQGGFVPKSPASTSPSGW